jgi:hypothetical protein
MDEISIMPCCVPNKGALNFFFQSDETMGSSVGIKLYVPKMTPKDILGIDPYPPSFIPKDETKNF